MKKILLAVLLTILAVACGDPEIDLTEVSYQPKITVEGYVYPGEQIKGIIFSRNLPLNVYVDSIDVFLDPVDNAVEAKINGIPLTFDEDTYTWYSSEIGQFNTSYELVISAVIDGKELSASSVTTTPAQGFEVLEEDLGTIVYRSKDVEFNFTPSIGSEIYAFSIVPDVATPENFIYDNPYFPNMDTSDVEDDLNTYKFQSRGIINIDNTTTEPINQEVMGLDLWFFSPYKIICYAGDKNMKDFVITAGQVQQFDGNFVEPRLHFTGDAVGVFGSAIRDTVYFNLVRPQ